MVGEREVCGSCKFLSDLVYLHTAERVRQLPNKPSTVRWNGCGVPLRWNKKAGKFSP